MTEQENPPWEGSCSNAAYAFALQCAELVTRNPHHLDEPLSLIINDLMTELWDRNFSQTEIRAAFENTLKALPLYAAGQERRSSTSTMPITADWRTAQ